MKTMLNLYDNKWFTFFATQVIFWGTMANWILGICLYVVWFGLWLWYADKS